MELVTVDKSRFNDIIEAYFLWKKLNSIIKQSHTRIINFPETISEGLVCYATGFKLIRGSEGDALDEQSNSIVEIKATSNYTKDTTSFGPKEQFDILFFARLNQDDDIIYIYNTGYNSGDVKRIMVNSTETVEDQQKQGRRPRFSVIKEVINKNGLTPYYEVNLRTKKIKKV